MHFTQKLMYMAFGCLLTLAGYILASVSSDSIAQSGAEDVTFGEITCRKLNVIDDEGNKSVRLYLNKNGGAVVASGKDGGLAALANYAHGGFVGAYGKGGDYGVQLFNDEYGGGMAIFNKDGETAVKASVADGGGLIETRDKAGNPTGKLP